MSLAKRWEQRFSSAEVVFPATAFDFEGTAYLAAKTLEGTFIYKAADVENWLCLIEDPDIHEVLTTGASVYDYLEVIEDPRVARFAKDELCIYAYTKDCTPIIDDT